MISRYLAATIIIVVFALALTFQKQALHLFSPNVASGQVSAAKANQSVYPAAVNNFQSAPEITATSAQIIDAKTGFVLWEKNPDAKHLPASTTKLMTALVALEKCLPQTVVTASGVNKSGSQMGLEAGDRVTVENLIKGLLINSGNDAAQLLASSCSDSVSLFVDSMNEKAKSLNMQNTHFANPAGFDDPFQYSTAEDLAKLARIAVGNPTFAKIVATKSTVVTDVSGNKTYYLQNVNQLIGEVDGIEGIKTGETEGSLGNLITKTTRNGNSIIAVVLGSHDRFSESKSLIEWAFAAYIWASAQ